MQLEISPFSAVLAPSLYFGVLQLLSYAFGIAVAFMGPRVVGTTGCVLLGISQILAGCAARTNIELIILYGVVGGIGAGMLMIPSLMTVSLWFRRRRSLAMRA